MFKKINLIKNEISEITRELKNISDDVVYKKLWDRRLALKEDLAEEMK